jgi:hypothetical protein
MQFLKKHYEKFLLGFVLAGLIAVLVFMLFYIATDKQSMEENVNSLIHPSVKPLPDLNLTTNNTAMERLKSPYTLDLETGNKVFNPFEWQKTLDGRMVRKASLGAKIAHVTKIEPLYLELSLESVQTNEFGVRYVVSVEDQSAKSASKRQKQRRFVSMGDKPNDIFSLETVKGPPASPESLTLKLVDSGDTATIGPGKPFRRVEDYQADISYEPEKKTFRDRRVGDRMAFGGTVYQIVEINSHEVVLADLSNQKKTSLPFKP